MKKAVQVVVLPVILAVFLGLAGCSSSSSDSSGDDTGGGGDSGGGGTDTTTAAYYAKFGEDLSNTVPDGLKTGGVNADISAALEKTLSGACATDYTGCPYITASGGGDSTSGEILLRLWSLDYNDECTSSYLADGTCFDCVDCNTGSVGTTYFIKPTMLASPSACSTTDTTQGRYVNFGVDPCFFDKMIAQISNIAECMTVAGGAVNISSAIPWYTSWGIPQTINFSSYYAKEDENGGGIWWTVNTGSAGNTQYFLSLDPNWLYAGIKDSVNDEFMFLGTGSPAYYSGRGEGTGVNIAAYTGTLSAIPAVFEAIQVRVQDPNKYIERMKSNGTYVWYQNWSGNDFPDALADVDTVKNSPSDNRCVQIGTSVVTSKYVPLTDCVTSFGASSVTALNQDSNYTLKVIDGTTASAISFSASLTPTVTTTSCMEETAQ